MAAVQAVVLGVRPEHENDTAAVGDADTAAVAGVVLLWGRRSASLDQQVYQGAPDEDLRAYTVIHRFTTPMPHSASTALLPAKSPELTE